MILEPVENLLNRNLARSPRARELCAELAGRRIAIELRGFGRIRVESDGVSVRLAGAPDAPDAPADAVLSGGPLSMLALAGDDARGVLRRGDVRIQGDVELAQRFRELAMLLLPDPEEELAALIGDAPAHRLGRLAGGAFGWVRRAVDTTVRNAGEFLAHERRDLVPAAEGEAFFERVDGLREDVDRLEARIALVEARAATARAGQSAE